ncbi:hypothetical protein ABW19_dt0208447 [Dactylella cylindrospora]|nr:hypothetical protein ABW19_dt0208447 [Dactylella cylindrospora]
MLRRLNKLFGKSRSPGSRAEATSVAVNVPPSLSREPEALPQDLSPLFLIPELLTQILLSVPPIQVLTSCRRVSRTWKALIETSPELIYYTKTGYTDFKPGAGAKFDIDERLADRTATPNENISNKPMFTLTPVAQDALQIIWERLVQADLVNRPPYLGPYPPQITFSRGGKTCHFTSPAAKFSHAYLTRVCEAFLSSPHSLHIDLLDPLPSIREGSLRPENSCDYFNGRHVKSDPVRNLVVSSEMALMEWVDHEVTNLDRDKFCRYLNDLSREGRKPEDHQIYLEQVLNIFARGMFDLSLVDEVKLEVRRELGLDGDAKVKGRYPTKERRARSGADCAKILIRTSILEEYSEGCDCNRKSRALDKSVVEVTLDCHPPFSVTTEAYNLLPPYYNP